MGRDYPAVVNYFHVNALVETAQIETFSSSSVSGTVRTVLTDRLVVQLVSSHFSLTVTYIDSPSSVRQRSSAICRQGLAGAQTVCAASHCCWRQLRTSCSKRPLNRKERTLPFSLSSSSLCVVHHVIFCLVWSEVLDACLPRWRAAEKLSGPPWWHSQSLCVTCSFASSERGQTASFSQCRDITRGVRDTSVSAALVFTKRSMKRSRLSPTPEYCQNTMR